MLQPTLYSRPKSIIVGILLALFFGAFSLFYVLKPSRAIIAIIGVLIAGGMSEGILWFIAAFGLLVFVPVAISQYNEKLRALQGEDARRTAAATAATANDVLAKEGL